MPGPPPSAQPHNGSRNAGRQHALHDSMHTSGAAAQEWWALLWVYAPARWAASLKVRCGTGQGRGAGSRQLCKAEWWHLEELVLQQLSAGGPEGRVLLQALLHNVMELLQHRAAASESHAIRLPYCSEGLGLQGNGEPSVQAPGGCPCCSAPATARAMQSVSSQAYQYRA